MAWETKPSRLASKQKSYCLILIISCQPFVVSWAVHTQLHVSSRPAGAQKLLWRSASNWCAVHQESDQKYLFLFYSTSLLCLFPVRNVAVDLWQLCVQRYNSVSSVGLENTSNILIWRALIGTPWLPGCTFLVFPFSSGIPTAFPCLHCHSLLSHLISEVPLSAFVLETWKSLP